jgi:hypothetical protein
VPAEEGFTSKPAKKAAVRKAPKRGNN